MDNRKFLWVHCDSRADLESRLVALHNVRVLPIVETDDANSWGFVRISDNDVIAIPVGYADVGLIPSVTITDTLLLIGICELVAGIDMKHGNFAFRYRVPTIFHEFVRVDAGGILLRDEIGFVLLSHQGNERWKFCKDLIQSYELTNDELAITTVEGQSFRIRIGETEALAVNESTSS